MKFKTADVLKPEGEYEGMVYISTELIDALVTCEIVFQDFGGVDNQGDMVVTSLRDGEHMEGSLHYKGRAADLRTWYFPDDNAKIEAAEELRNILYGFDVILEDTHIHIEKDN